MIYPKFKVSLVHVAALSMELNNKSIKDTTIDSKRFGGKKAHRAGPQTGLLCTVRCLLGGRE